MNSKILQKCLDELNKEESDISYIKGMIETLIDINWPLVSAPATVLPPTGFAPGSSTPIQSLIDPDPIVAMADAAARASLETIKGLAEKSQNE